MAKKSKITQMVEILGNQVEGVVQEFTTEQEGVGIYRLANGGVVRIRLLVDQILLTDKDKNSGQPMVVVKQGAMVVYDAPPSSKKSTNSAMISRKPRA